MASRLLDPETLEGVVTKLERLSESLAARHRAMIAALALADRPTGAVDLLIGTADEADWWASVLRDRIEWAEHHDPFAESGEMVDGLAIPRAALGDVGANGSASGWELPGMSTLWQPWHGFDEHAREAATQAGLEWPDHRRDLTTVLAPMGSLLAEVSGAADAKRCLQGSFSACGWFMAGLVPWGRLARIARLAHYADGAFEGGGELARRRSLLADRFSVDELMNAGGRLDRGGHTAAGRSLQKHGDRVGSVYPKVAGTPSNRNAVGEQVLREILTNPGVTVVESTHRHFGDILEVFASDGRGVRFLRDGTFVGFLEP